jgi:hypothetical protein
MDSDLQAHIAALAEVAVEHAQQSFQTKLDYSPESLRLVEEILGKLHSTVPKGFFSLMLGRKATPEQVSRMATAYGAYIGEVTRSRWGGEWSMKSALYAEPTLTLRVHGEEIYPPGKAYKRLINGPEDNVWHYYHVLARDYGENEP